jgi:hypothetical protein
MEHDAGMEKMASTRPSIYRPYGESFSIGFNLLYNEVLYIVKQDFFNHNPKDI